MTIDNIWVEHTICGVWAHQRRQLDDHQPPDPRHLRGRRQPHQRQQRQPGQQRRGPDHRRRQLRAVPGRSTTPTSRRPATPSRTSRVQTTVARGGSRRLRRWRQHVQQPLHRRHPDLPGHHHRLARLRRHPGARLRVHARRPPSRTSRWPGTAVTSGAGRPSRRCGSTRRSSSSRGSGSATSTSPIRRTPA